ncbi:MAG: ABC transporter ATP-binding protein, partial [Oscillospiraceae bacterium]|nr:ABC transporter ATP-binding protein [Oscillospiraceae bacterium]
MGGPGAMMHGEKPKDFTGTLKKILKLLAPYRVSLVIVLIFAVASTVFSILGPKILGNAITEIFNGLVSKFSGGSGIDFAKIGGILLTLLALYAASSLFAFIQGWIMSYISQDACYLLRMDISKKIGRMPMKYFESRTVGEVLSRITNDVDTLGQSLNQSLTQLISSVVTIAGVLAMMLSISWQMTLIALAVLPVSMLLISFVMKFSQKYFKAQQEQLGNINGQIEETISGHNVVKLFNYERKAIESFNEINSKLY